MFLRQPRGLSGGLCWERGTRAQRGRGRGREKAREREQERKAQNTLQLEVGKRKEFQRFVFFFFYSSICMFLQRPFGIAEGWKRGWVVRK